MRWTVLVIVTLAGCLGGLGASDETCAGRFVEVIPPVNDQPEQSGEFFAVASGERFQVIARAAGTQPDHVTWHISSLLQSAGFEVRNESAVGNSHNLTLAAVGAYQVTATPSFGDCTGPDGLQQVGVAPYVGIFDTFDVGVQGFSLPFEAFCCPGMTGIRLIDRPPIGTWTVTLTADDGVEVWRSVVGPTGLAGIGSTPYEEALGSRFYGVFTLAVTSDIPVPPIAGTQVEVCIGYQVNPGEPSGIDLCSF